MKGAGWNANPEDDDRRARPGRVCVGCGATFAVTVGSKVRCAPCGYDHMMTLKRARDAARRQRKREAQA